MSSNEIWIRGMDLPVRIGVPDEERAGWQVLSADVGMEVTKSFESMADEVTHTIDYEAVANRLKTLAAERPRHLIETLAAEIVEVVLKEFGAHKATVELRKRILPGVDHVAVRLVREG
jgi:dihydroneopterin aldolase